MAKPTIYKKIPSTEVDKREVFNASDAEKTRVNTIISNFLTYFKAKHS